MTPNFALSLSVDGIRLLHAVPAGWQRAGEVSLDVADLTAAMADLRAVAEDLEPDGLRTKLVLPADQIKFLTIDTARTSIEDIHSAITESTPLALEDMVIDFDRSGGRTHIAAVARQTLVEAEEFARGYGFAPVSFAAVPEPYTFQGEVFFGPTTYAADELGAAGDLQRADTPAVETVAAPVTEVVEEPIFTRRNRDDAEAQTDTAPAPTPSEPAANTPIAQFNRSATTPSPALAPAPAAAAPVQSRRRSRVLAADEDASGLLEQFSDRDSDPAPHPIVAPPSRVDAALAARAKTAALDDTPRYLSIAAAIAAAVILLFAAIWAGGRISDGITAMFDRSDPLIEEDALAPVIVPEAPAPAVPEQTAVAPVVEPTIAEPAPEEPQQPIVTAIPGRVLSPADAARIYAATGVWQKAPRLPDSASAGTLDGLVTFDTIPNTPRVAQPSRPDITAPTPDLRLIRQPNPAPINRPVRRDENGFILATPNGTLLPTGIIIYGKAPVKEPPRRPTDEPVGLDDNSIPAFQSDVAALALVAQSQTLDVARLTTTLPDSALRVTAAPEISSPALNAPAALADAAVSALPPQFDEPGGPADESVLVAADMSTVTPVIAAPIADEGTSLVSFNGITDARRAAAVEAPIAPQADVPVTRTGFVTAAAPTTVPDTAASTDAPQTEFVEVISGRPAITPPLRPGTPEIAPGPTQEEIAAALTPPEDAAPEVEEPTTLATAETPDVFQDPTLASFRAVARPADLVPPSRSTFEAIPALAGSRPLIRPAGLVPEPVIPEPEEVVAPDPDTGATDANIAAIVASIAAAAPPSTIRNPTASAIAVSPRPDARPRNFAQVVASAQAISNRQADREAASATAAAVVAAPRVAPTTSGSTSVTVARAATVDNAINLRNMNLIGVYGKPGARRALIRLSNGRFVKVEVGSSLDGGRVTAIGDDALNFVKRGQTYALQLPAG